MSVRRKSTAVEASTSLLRAHSRNFKAESWLCFSGQEQTSIFEFETQKAARTVCHRTTWAIPDLAASRGYALRGVTHLIHGMPLPTSCIHMQEIPASRRHRNARQCECLFFHARAPGPAGGRDEISAPMTAFALWEQNLHASAPPHKSESTGCAYVQKRDARVNSRTRHHATCKLDMKTV